MTDGSRFDHLGAKISLDIEQNPKTDTYLEQSASQWQSDMCSGRWTPHRYSFRYHSGSLWRISNPCR